MNLKPPLHALVGWYAEPFGLIGVGTVVPLEDAPGYQELGAWILVDPADERDLAQYEREQRLYKLMRHPTRRI